jgi:hypothetical protein
MSKRTIRSVVVKQEAHKIRSNKHPQQAALATRSLEFYGGLQRRFYVETLER